MTERDDLLAGGSPSAIIRRRALELGFAAVGIARVEPLEAARRYEAWLADGRHGAMAYLATDRHRERRAHPSRVLAGVRSIVCVALAHEPSLPPERRARLGGIARYAGGEDYHRVMRDLLGELERAIVALLPGAAALGYSDTGAILERAWAERSGIGWIGKNTCTISPTLGSYLLLGEVLVDRELDPDAPATIDHCGTCRRCIDVCPTGAITGPRELDARRCISYLTIELRGPIPIELRPLVGDWIFGCDVCQEVCPWNRFAPPAREARLHARALEGWTLERFLSLDEAGFARLFEASPIRRARRAGFLRNVCVALGNRGEAAAAPALRHALVADPDALVRGHAAWALGRIAARAGDRAAAAAALQRAAADDADEGVREEARLAALEASGG
jgi:epoxyqueuosine reductase